MRLRKLLNHIRDKALAIKNVNSFSSTDVYETYNKSDIRYSNVTFSLRNTERTDNTIRYNFLAYFADRLLVFDKDSNENEIVETGIDVINSIINSLDDEITYETPLVFTPFSQQFSDYLAGVYCEVTLETEYEQGNCELISEIPHYLVRFIDIDHETVIEQHYVEQGASVEPPVPPQHARFEFDKWSTTTTEIKRDTDVFAMYKPLTKELTTQGVHDVSDTYYVAVNVDLEPEKEAVRLQITEIENYIDTHEYRYND